MSIICTGIILLVTLVFVSCENDDLNSNRVKIYPVINSQIETAIETRALPETYNIVYTGSDRIYAYAYAYAGAPQVQNISGSFSFSPSAHKWNSSLEVENGRSYRLYAHTAMPGASSTTMNYASGILTINGLGVLSDTDPLVCTASASTANALSEGSFDIGQIPTNIDPNNPPKVYLGMKHLYSRATVAFKIDPTYNQLRTIKVTKVTISSTEGGTYSGNHSYSFSNMALTPASTTPSGTDKEVELIGSANQIVHFDNGSTTEITLDNNEYHNFGWFTFLSLKQTPPNLSMTVEYNVYDTENQVMRAQGLTVTNTKILKGITGATGGNDYRIKIIVKPTYLYELSDNDVSLELDFGN